MINPGREFLEEDQVPLSNSRLKLFPGKLNSRYGPFNIIQVFLHGVVEISHPEKGTFKVNGHMLKQYFTEDHNKFREFSLL